MGPGRGAARYGFPGGRVWALGEWSADQRFAGTMKGAPRAVGKSEGIGRQAQNPRSMGVSRARVGLLS